VPPRSRPSHCPLRTNANARSADRCPPTPPQGPNRCAAAGGVPHLGGSLESLGEDVTEFLEYIPVRFKVIRRVRPKLACACCGCIVQEPAPRHVIDRGLVGPGLLAHILVAEYADHRVPRT
jgi:transposase